jgi:Na+/melibiose symporter-like transporter
MHVLATPSWFTDSNLKTLAVGVLIALAALSFIVTRFVQKLALKLALLVVCVGLGAAVFVQRSNLSDCATTCSCKVFGVKVKVSGTAATACQNVGKIVGTG